MKQQRSPYFTLFFLVFVMAGLFIISIVFPDRGIKITKNIIIKFPTFSSLVNNDKPKYAAIPEVVFKADTVSLEAIKTATKTRIDTVFTDETDTITRIVKAYMPILKEPASKLEINSQKIEFKDKDGSVLYGFFNKLEEARDNRKPLRIVHFGDSQIEGDRISGFIRERLQSRFGGGGPGLVPALKIYNQASVTHDNIGQWFRYTIFGNVDKNVTHNRYGVMCAFSRFTPFGTGSETNAVTTSITKYNTKTSIYPSAKKFQKLKIYYGKVESEVGVEVLNNDNILVTQTLNETENLNVKTINFDNSIDNATLIFKGTNSPDIYGVSLEMPYGISVDNIAMRGGSGTVFNKMDKGVLSGMLKDMNTELIIMQFGGNVMPYIKDEKGCKDYGNWFYAQLTALKAAKPGVAIIVIGPADMSIKKDDYFETYPHFENVRDALKAAAFKAGAGFWDMYLAMGGKNSMPSWVSANPPLASSDYIHFSPRGARIIAELFYEALNYEYENYRYKNVEASKE